MFPQTNKFGGIFILGGLLSTQKTSNRLKKLLFYALYFKWPILVFKE